MKKLLCVVFLVIMSPVQATGADLFKGEIDKAARGVVKAWRNGDMDAMKRSYEDLVRYETYQLSVGKWSPEESYLSHIPAGETNLNSTATAIFLLYLKRVEGVDLGPRSFFENKKFQIEMQQ